MTIEEDPKRMQDAMQYAVLVFLVTYFLPPEILILRMVVSRLILVIDTSILFISRTSIFGRREYSLSFLYYACTQ